MSMFTAFGRFFGVGAGSPPRSDGLQSGAPAFASPPAANVTTDSAMQVSAVWGAVRLISETIASLPFELYERLPNGDRRPTAHELRRVLRNKPNRYQTPVEFWETLALNLALSGNAYAIIERSAVGRILSLMPISTSQVQTTLLTDGTITHTYATGADVRVYSSATMWHIKLFGNGIVGMSPLDYARNSVGVSVAAESRVSKIYSNGAKPAGVLTIDRVLSKEQREAVKANFGEMEEGSQDRLFVLEAGMKYQQISMSPQDIELLDSRRFQIEDIGRFFGVPSILLNQTFGQSSLGSNVYEIISGFYKLNLRPYLEKIEASIIRWLLDADPDRYEAEFDFDSLLRGDTLTRYQANREAVHSGQLTPNEARALEGRPALAGGDSLMIQSATVPITQLQGGANGAQNTQP